jgi:hypothetical protein
MSKWGKSNSLSHHLRNGATSSRDQTLGSDAVTEETTHIHSLIPSFLVLFNDTVGSSVCTELNDRMICKQGTGNDKEGTSHSLVSRYNPIIYLEQCSATFFHLWHIKLKTVILTGTLTILQTPTQKCITPSTYVTYIQSQNMHIFYTNTATLFLQPHAIMWLHSHATLSAGFQSLKQTTVFEKYFNISKYI